MIMNALAHRANVERSTSVLVNGTPQTSWSVVSVRTPVLFSKDPKPDPDPTWTAEQRKESHSRGTLFAAPGADIRPGDRIRLTRPADLGLTLAVLSDPSAVLDLHQVHHREFAVRSVG